MSETREIGGDEPVDERLDLLPPERRIGPWSLLREVSGDGVVTWVWYLHRADGGVQRYGAHVSSSDPGLQHLLQALWERTEPDA